ncbi:MAG: hypothetical protein P4L10_09210, partial [Acidobacteriaceae bacterium]|nr:hypothetical protein [Acidobacteriaceae bacterium]
MIDLELEFELDLRRILSIIGDGIIKLNVPADRYCAIAHHTVLIMCAIMFIIPVLVALASRFLFRCAMGFWGFGFLGFWGFG